MRRASLLISALAIGAPSAASAQEPTVVLSAYTPPAPASAFVSGPSADARGLAGQVASLPLRLSLLASLYPLGPAFSPGGCGAASVAEAGTIFPTQPYGEIQLTPRLVLHGFSDLGCPGDSWAGIDAGAGGGLTYAAPLLPGAWLVSSLGGYAVPPHLGVPARAVVGGGLDLATQRRDGRVWTAGLGVTALGRGVRVIPRVGGTF